jgi:hypothetical protein
MGVRMGSRAGEGVTGGALHPCHRVPGYHGRRTPVDHGNGVRWVEDGYE